jgi:hypothetical protein
VWSDGLGHQIKIRQQAISSVIDFIKAVPGKCTDLDFGLQEQRKSTTNIFQELQQWCIQTDVTARSENVTRCQFADRFVVQEADSRS